MIYRLVFTFSLVLLLSTPLAAMEPPRNEDEALELAFKTLLQERAGTGYSPTEIFNSFVAQRVHQFVNSSNSFDAIKMRMQYEGEKLPDIKNSYNVDIALAREAEQGKKTHRAIADFCKKYSVQYPLTDSVQEDLDTLERMSHAVDINIALEYHGRVVMLDEYLTLKQPHPGDCTYAWITAFESEQIPAIIHIFDTLPSVKAIEALPGAIRMLQQSQQRYADFVCLYPNNKYHARCQEKLAKSKDLLAKQPQEYFKDKPSKDEVERIHLASLFRRIGYQSLQQRYEALAQETDDEQYLKVFAEINNAALAIRDYAATHPNLEPRYLALLDKSATQIEKGLMLHNPIVMVKD